MLVRYRIPIATSSKISVLRSGRRRNYPSFGLNGAGKTTFIKLLCRLYQPTKGTITLNGVDINSIPLEDYLRFLSVVFQDFQLLGYPIDMNIAASEKPDSAESNTPSSSLASMGSSKRCRTDCKPRSIVPWTRKGLHSPVGRCRKSPSPGRSIRMRP